jgi:hypothetical protein
LGTLWPVCGQSANSSAHHAALPYPEVTAFLRALRESNASGLVKLAFELTVLSAVRTSETLLATWTEVDLSTQTWTIPMGYCVRSTCHTLLYQLRCAGRVYDYRDYR